jgi:hypothetical protein
MLKQIKVRWMHRMKAAYPYGWQGKDFPYPLISVQPKTEGLDSKRVCRNGSRVNLRNSWFLIIRVQVSLLVKLIIYYKKVVKVPAQKNIVKTNFLLRY